MFELTRKDKPCDFANLPNVKDAVNNEHERIMQTEPIVSQIQQMTNPNVKFRSNVVTSSSSIGKQSWKRKWPEHWVIPRISDSGRTLDLQHSFFIELEIV